MGENINYRVKEGLFNTMDAQRVLDQRLQTEDEKAQSRRAWSKLSASFPHTRQILVCEILLL